MYRRGMIDSEVFDKIAGGIRAGDEGVMGAFDFLSSSFMRLSRMLKTLKVESLDARVYDEQKQANKGHRDGLWDVVEAASAVSGAAAKYNRSTSIQQRRSGGGRSAVV